MGGDSIDFIKYAERVACMEKGISVLEKLLTDVSTSIEHLKENLIPRVVSLEQIISTHLGELEKRYNRRIALVSVILLFIQVSLTVFVMFWSK